jgi:hypothetical protein
MEIVGAADIAKEMVGKDLGEILGRAEPLGVTLFEAGDAPILKGD